VGSSLGVAIAGSLVAGASASFGKPFALAIVVLGIFAMVGWVAALLLPRATAVETATEAAPTEAGPSSSSRRTASRRTDNPPS
jgi:hypothetical protein